MRTYEMALLLHLLGAMLFVSGLVLAGMTFEVARRVRTPTEVALMLGLARIGVLLVAVGGILLPVFGLWLVHLGGWGYGSSWVDEAIVLYVLALALGGLGGRRPKQARKLASRLAGEGSEISCELRGLLDDRASRAANYLSALLMLAIIALMVFK
jgi:uncharacterized membrane protein